MHQKDLPFLLEEKLNELVNIRFIERGRPSFIPIHLTGGIGDMIMDGETVRRISRKYPVFAYTKHIGAFKYFYPEIPAFTDLHSYDWHIEFNTTLRFVFNEGFSGFLLPEHQMFYEEQCNRYKANRELYAYCKKTPTHDAVMSLYAKEQGQDRRSFAGFAMGWDKEEYKIIPQEDPEDYITIHDGYDTGMKSVGNRSNKQWTLDYWTKTVRALKRYFPRYEILQLGSKTSRPIDGANKSFLNKTTITGAFDIIKKSRLHIDGDSGFVHAATKMSVPCVVMFGPTPDHFYGYPQNINLRSKACPGSCYWIKENWMEKCVLGYDNPKCMDAIEPEDVLTAVYEFLK